MPTWHDREAQLAEFHRVYALALQEIGRRTFSSEDAAVFVHDTTDDITSALQRLADTRAALQIFIKEVVSDPTRHLSASTALLKDIQEIEKAHGRFND
jgi:hypothetical protein